MNAYAGNAREQLGRLAPKLAQITDDILFGDIWERPALTARERSLITVAALIALCRDEQLLFHLQRALGNGVSAEELGEVITHLAFYAGWPAAANAVKQLDVVTAQSDLRS